MNVLPFSQLYVFGVLLSLTLLSALGVIKPSTFRLSTYFDGIVGILSTLDSPVSPRIRWVIRCLGLSDPLTS